MSTPKLDRLPLTAQDPEGTGVSLCSSQAVLRLPALFTGPPPPQSNRAAQIALGLLPLASPQGKLILPGLATLATPTLDQGRSLEKPLARGRPVLAGVQRRKQTLALEDQQGQGKVRERGWGG